MSAIIAKTTTADVLAPIPCMKRASNKNWIDGAKAQAVAPINKIPFPMIMIFLRPQQSDKGPKTRDEKKNPRKL